MNLTNSCQNIKEDIATESYQLFYDHLTDWLEHTEKPRAFIVLDIDNFNLVNLMFGHDVGNEALTEISTVLRSRVHNYGIFARRYADRYSIMMNYESREWLETWCKDLIRALQHLPCFAAHRFRLKPAMGIYCVAEDVRCPHAVMERAILARKSVKNKYERYYHFFTEDLIARQIADKKLFDAICNGLDNKEFVPYYQTLYDMKTLEPIGVEALIRWPQADGSMMLPAQYIHFAEKTGIISDIDNYMLNTVCQHIAQWHAAGLTVLPVAVNVSRHRISRGDFVNYCKMLLNRYQLPVGMLRIEITEGILAEKGAVGQQLINDLKSIGIEVLIDDFGTGYSSLSMLKSFPAKALKIDKTFVDDVSRIGREFIDVIIKLGKLMGMRIVAEGVETKAQYEFLLQHGCDTMQGYYIAKPVDHDTLQRSLRPSR